MLTTLDRRQTRRQATDAEFPRYVSMYDVNEILVHLEGDEQRLFHEEKTPEPEPLTSRQGKLYMSQRLRSNMKKQFARECIKSNTLEDSAYLLPRISLLRSNFLLFVSSRAMEEWHVSRCIGDC